jgi:hypothetical protein
LLH